VPSQTRLLLPLYRKALDELLQIFITEATADSIQPYDFRE
jgi:hypothetical protein